MRRILVALLFFTAPSTLLLADEPLNGGNETIVINGSAPACYPLTTSSFYLPAHAGARALAAAELSFQKALDNAGKLVIPRELVKIGVDSQGRPMYNVLPDGKVPPGFILQHQETQAGQAKSTAYSTSGQLGVPGASAEATRTDAQDIDKREHISGYYLTPIAEQFRHEADVSAALDDYARAAEALSWTSYQTP